MSSTQIIDQQIAELNDWRGERLAKIRKLVMSVDPEITEEVKWGVPVWTKNGMICSAGSFKDHLKINFFSGALLADSDNLFNAGLEAKKSRAIDIYESDSLDMELLSKLVKLAIAANNN